MASNQSSQIKLGHDDHHVMVAAIDFGTTFSGYAFSFTSSPNNIKMNKNWSESLGFQSYKAPTCILTGHDHNFVAFGYDAENRYSEIVAEDGESDDYHMYRQFKMMLYNEKSLSRETLVTSTAGHKRRALDIFAMALKYLKQHLLDTVRRSFAGNSDESLVKWVITVPAIWSDEAKQFMREAVFQAGLIRSKDSKQLVIALEPEAASLFCRTLDIDHFLGGDTGTKSANFKTGTKYLVIDAGGGTIDITAHEILPTGQVKELHSANGGAWGGTKVDQNFIKLLSKTLGTKFIEAYIKECPQQWMMLMINFEKVKKAVKPDGVSKLTIPLAWSMGSKYREVMGGDIESAIKKASEFGIIFSNGSLIIKHEAIVEMYDPVVKEIISHIEVLMKLPKLHSCQYFMLVGGFGESAFLQSAIDKVFGENICLLVPSEAQMSVIKGAVLFGHQPEAIKSRVSRKTYGIKVRRTFIEGLHDPSKKITQDGYSKCRFIFDPFLQCGEDVETNFAKSITYGASNEDQTAMGIMLYATDEPVPTDVLRYVDDKDMKEVGHFTIDMPDTRRGKDRSIQLDIVFGGTEITIHATDISSGCTAEASIDFLTE